MRMYTPRNSINQRSQPFKVSAVKLRQLAVFQNSPHQRMLVAQLLQNGYIRRITCFSFFDDRQAQLFK